ncbi:hypothetical protein CMI38_04055 [Candidatus Pacearchaeota archaeon]|jgi:CheY-like chemotaxis protein|nr:hypothetical protein [Candidatus Pacearchaeota archaeon]|tara:strand:- start:60 stop:401 length:342 start_codon:yes stop_codon:yes gene_type:complete
MVKVLVVDDDEGMRNSYELLFRAVDYECICAEDGNEGLAKALEHNPDLIISDRNMPNMNGYEMALRLRGDEGTKPIPLIGIGDFQEFEKYLFNQTYLKGNVSVLKVIQPFLEK